MTDACDLDRTIRQAMLQWLISHYGDDYWDDTDRPMEVLYWEEHGYMPTACETCGDEWPEVIIHYRAADGREYDEIVAEDFGTFIRHLCTPIERKEPVS